jgi:hypothetical protein
MTIFGHKCFLANKKNLLVKLSIFIADSERAIKVAQPSFKSAERRSLNVIKKFGQK